MVVAVVNQFQVTASQADIAVLLFLRVIIRVVHRKPRLQIEFLRRKTDVDLTYGPEFAGGLPDGFAAATETEVVKVGPH